MTHASVIVAISNEDLEQEGSVHNAVTKQMEPFQQGNVYFKDGSRWDWWTIGGQYADSFGPNCAVRRKQIKEEKLRHCAIAHAKNGWDAFQTETDDFVKSLYNINETITYDEFIAEESKKLLVAFAFLKDHVWHERTRLGWFGCTIKTECQINQEDFKGRCVHERAGSKIISWDDDKDWEERFFDRFIRRLPDDTMIVGVDYHI